MAAALPRAQIVEVSPRDGLQNESVLLSTQAKIDLIGRLAAIGAKRIEVGSFVNPKRVPQMADTEAVISGLPSRNARSYSAIGLCLNLRGVERAIAGRESGTGGVDEAGCVIVATDSFGIRNQGQSLVEGLVANRAMLALAKAHGLRAQLTIGAAFGCPFEGRVDPDRVIGIALQMVDAGAEEIALADTIGVAVPAQVGDLCGRLIERLPSGFALRIHLHDTRGLAPANAWAAFQAGVRTFDAALGGLGGCPFAPNATGNVATEDLAYLFDHSDVDHNIDLAAALEANRWLSATMNRPLPSRVGRAGDFVITPQREVEAA